VDLSYNRIASHKMLRVFELTAGLTSLTLAHNVDGKQALANYRAPIIYITRYLAGSNRAPGLQVSAHACVLTSSKPSARV
jgi:hypothetical protein